MSDSQLIIYENEDGNIKLDVILENETVWLTMEQMANLFNRSKSTVNDHILNAYKQEELKEEGTKRKIGNSDFSTKPTNYYNLDVIISVGYRVKSKQGTAFRIWATQRLREYIVKGFVLNDARFKSGNSMNYFDELQSRIREIRLSERFFYQKIKDIYTTSIDYDSFNNIVKAINEDDEVELLGQEHSETLFNHCLEKGYVDKNGKVQDLLRIAIKEDNVELPEQFTEGVKVKNQILEVLKKVAGKLEIKNNADKKKVKVNTKVLESPEFKALWERVKYKTVFSVDFDSDSLVKACIMAIDDGMKLVRGKLVYTKAALDITEGGVQADEGNVKKSVSNLDVEVTQLPDIVGYLQNETNLTRRSIVDILLGTAKLKYFKINPQKFIEECIKIINEQMQLHIVDGISYEKIGDTAFYKQELFENQELFGYIESNLKESEKTPYEYVVYDSNVESSLIQEFENHDNISVYAKLPAWFKIDTPLGTYNPDWAIMWNDENEEKLYFVVESKGTTSLIDLRTKESAKIECGKAHFKAIGTKMLVVKDINGVEEYALEKS